MDHFHVVQKAVEGGLIRRSSIDRGFHTTGLPGGIVVDVEVGGFIEAMQSWSRAGRREVRMYVGVPSSKVPQLDCGRMWEGHTRLRLTL
jgi:hypothetical protein